MERQTRAGARLGRAHMRQVWQGKSSRKSSKLGGAGALIHWGPNLSKHPNKPFLPHRGLTG